MWRHQPLFTHWSFGELGVDVEMSKVSGVFPDVMKENALQCRGFVAIPSWSRLTGLFEFVTPNDFATLDPPDAQRFDE